MNWMAPYESMGWVGGVNGSLWKCLMGKNEWLEPSRILKSLSGWDRPSDRVCVMVGTHDVPVDLRMAERQVSEFREAVRAVTSESASEVKEHAQLGGYDGEDGASIPGIDLKTSDRVRYVVVHGAGHHMQNDVQAIAAAEALRRWLEHL